MERYNFEFTVEPTETVYGVDMSIHNEGEDFHACDVCDAFMHFMIAAGYSEKSVCEYFTNYIGE